MSLQDTEIQPGCYAWFDVKKLLADERVEHKAKAEFRDGPFICVQANEARSVWVELTRQDGAYGREWLKDEWRLEGDSHWLTGKSYFNSLNETFLGPNTAVIEAAASEPPYAPYLGNPRQQYPNDAWHIPREVRGMSANNVRCGSEADSFSLPYRKP